MELKHHGVKGQKWGVRNGPPYPIEDTVLKKGTKLNTVAFSKRDDATSMIRLGNPEIYRKQKGANNQWMYTYNNDHDQQVYKGAFATALVRYKGANYLDEHKYEVVRDLKMPTKKQRIDEFVELYNNNQRIVKNDLKNMQKRLKNKNIGDEEEKDKYQNFDSKHFDVNNEKQLDNAYYIFNQLMADMNKYKTARLYKTQIENKFDAMVDDHDQGNYNSAKDPIIVFKAEEVLRSIGTQPITSEDVSENYDKIRTYMENKKQKIHV